MEIFVNGGKLEFSLDGETDFGPVFSGLADWAGQGGKRVWSLQVDGTPYEVDKPEGFAGLPVAGITRVDVTVGDQDAAKEIGKRIEAFKAAVKSAIALIDGVTADIHQGNTGAAGQKWQQILQVINDFHQVLPMFADINISADRTSLEKDYTEFRDVLMEIHKTQEVKDNVAFVDQLQYELKPQLEKWQDFLTITRSSIKKG